MSRAKGTRVRVLVSRLVLFLTGACALVTIGALVALLAYIVLKGASALNLSFFVRLPAPLGDAGGGIANAIVGSLKLLLLASAIGVTVGFLGGLYLSEFGRGPVSFAVRYAADVLNGIPSIIVGIVAYALIVRPMGHFSTLAGGVALGIMMIPIVLRTTEELLRMVPEEIREAGLALGLPQWKVVSFVVVPTAKKGLVAGILLSLARVAGETAPLLFTALNNRVWSHGWLEPIASLPVVIFTYSISPYATWHQQAWAAALVLMAVVLGANLAARLAFLRGWGPG